LVRRFPAYRYVIGREFPRIAEIQLIGNRDGQHLLAEVHHGDGGEIAFHLREHAGQWTQVADFTDGIKHMEFGEDGRLYATSIEDAPLGRVIAIPLTDPSLAKARVVVPEANLGTEEAIPTRTRLYVRYRDGGPAWCAASPTSSLASLTPPSPRSMKRIGSRPTICWSAR
jgi:prolyl oligopeptidase